MKLLLQVSLKIPLMGRFSSISISCKGHSYQEEWGFIQTGGYDGADKDFVDISSDGKNWNQLPARIPDGLNISEQRLAKREVVW